MDAIFDAVIVVVLAMNDEESGVGGGGGVVGGGVGGGGGGGGNMFDGSLEPAKTENDADVTNEENQTRDHANGHD